MSIEVRTSPRAAMLTNLRAMPREKAQQINLLADCAALTGASFAASYVDGTLHWLVALGMAVGSMFLWTVQGRLLRHYDQWNGRTVGSDVALTVLAVGGLVALLGVLRLFVPTYAAGSELKRFAGVAVPLVLWLRLTINWLRRREPQERPVLIVGIGPLGRHTGLEMRDARDGRKMVGYLRFEHESIHDRLPATIL